MKPLLAVRHKDGELLRARDLAAEVAGEAARRAVHVLAVHDTWGVALGFSLGVGRSGLGAVVGPGFGYDRRGGELVSAATAFVPGPAADGRYDLTVAAGCRLEWRWREPGRACVDELVLARFSVADGVLSDPDVSVRRVCQRRRFRLAAGSKKTTLDQLIEVSTTSGGFRNVPFYFATLELPELQEAAQGPLVDIRGSADDAFELHLRAADDWWTAAGPDVTVHWLGVEPLVVAGGLEPEPAAVASPLDLPDEYATFEALPLLDPPDPD